MGLVVVLGPFLGRSADLVAIEACFERRGCAWVTGLAGIGKSRLVAEVARSRRALWVDAGGLRDAAALDAAIAAAAGLSEPRSSANVVAARCEAAGVDLLVLDDVDGVVAPARAWLEALAPRLRGVATSRHDLDVDWAVRAGPLDEGASAALLVELVPRNAVSGPPTKEDVHRIVRALGGHPLAIGLAAARLAVLTAEELVAELGPDLLRDPMGRGAHAGVDPLLRAATSSLPAAAMAVLRAAAVVRAPLPRDALGAAAGRRSEDTVDALQVLTGQHLLQALRTEDGAVFVAHPLVAAWVEARTPPATWKATARRFGRDLVDRVGEHPAGGEANDRWLFGRTPYVERLVALAEAGAADPSHAGAAVVALGKVHWRLDLVERVPAAAAGVQGRLEELRARILLARSDDPAGARDAATRAAEHLDAAGLPAEAWWARGFAAAAALVLDPHDVAAAALLDEAIGRMTEPRAAAELRRVRAVYAHAPNGRLDASAEDRRVYLAWARDAGEPGLVAQGLHSLAIALQALDDDAAAVVLLHEALVVASTFPWRPLAGFLMNSLGEDALKLRRFDEAVERCEAAAAWLDRVGLAPNAAHAWASATIARALRGERPPLPPEPGEMSRRWTSSRVWCALARGAAALAAGQEPPPVPDVHAPSHPVVTAWNGAAALLFEATRAAAAGDRVGARRLGKRAAERISDDVPPDPRARDVHLVASWLVEVRLGALIASLDSWQVAPDGTWFEGPDGNRVSLYARPLLVRLLVRLARGPADLEALGEAGWPGEHMTRDSRRNRVHVGLSTLRKLGLEALETTPDGWTLHLGSRTPGRPVAGTP